MLSESLQEPLQFDWRKYWLNPINLVLSIYLAYRFYQLFLPRLRFDELNDLESDKRRQVGIDRQPKHRRPLVGVDRPLPDQPIQYNWKPDRFPETLVWRTYTPLELSEFDGRNDKKILFAVNRVVYDVSPGRNFYGPDGPYGNFAGRDASRGLAKQSFDTEVLTPADSEIDKLEDLTDEERENLSEWEALFKSKYMICGELIENSDRAKRPL